ncbi:MAG: hypothetical protein RBT11_06910 [Desulfobacterales bacterium]|jgi:hypothetical protein|nr:hypothetical protein [Desulfobacterales bacterium]
MTTPQHCPGFENFRRLASFSCKCPQCNEEIEIFSDEFDKERYCPKCKNKIDFTQCTLTGSGG